MRKKLVSSVLALSIAALSLTGCQGGKTGVPETTQKEAEAVPDDNFNATGYPIVKEPITLKVLLCIRNTDSLMEINEMPAVKKLEELTGIHVEWEVVKGDDWNTKVNLMFSSGEYPDVILSSNSKVDYEEYGVTQQLLLPVDELIDQYMPIYKERAASEETDVLAGLKASDGKMYSIGSMMAQNINTPSHYFINQTWLDKLNLKMPGTLDELTEVLRAFKTQDPNGNGEADEIPFGLTLKDTISGINLVFPFFGIPASAGENSYLYVDDDGKVQFIPYQEGFRDAMEWMNLLYKEKLVDVEMVSQDLSMLESKLSEGNTGFFTAWRITQSTFSDWAEGNAVLMNPVAADGYKVSMTKTMELAKNGAYITAGNKHIPETMRWLDAQLDTEMMFTMFSGEEGEGWVYTDEGLIRTIDVVSERQVLKCLNVNSLFFAPGTYYSGVYEMAPHRVEKMEYCKQYTENGYMQKNSNTLLKLAPRTSDEMSRCTLIETDINNAIKENMALFITKGVTDENWEVFMKQFDNMNVDEYISIYQNALDKKGTD